MMPLISILIAVVFIAGMVFAARLAGRSRDGHRRLSQFAGWLLLLSGGLMVVDTLTGGRSWIGGAALAGVGVLVLLRSHSPQSDREARQAFREDPARCGRCGYSRQGIDRPTCPECGWRYPGPDEPIQARDVGAWWRHGWRIDYLENWRASAAGTGLLVLTFAAMAAVFAWRGPATAVGVIGPAAMAVLLGLNLARVLAYGWRQRGVAGGHGR